MKARENSTVCLIVCANSGEVLLGPTRAAWEAVRGCERLWLPGWLWQVH